MHIEDTVTPVAQTNRCIPFHVHKDVENQIAHDADLDIVEKTSEPTPWVLPKVCVPKPKTGKDMRQANKANKRERQSGTTLDANP